MEELILKYLSDELPPEKEAEFAQWLEEPGNREIFKNYVKLDYRLQHGLLNADGQDKIIPEFNLPEEDDTPVRSLHPQIWKYAAAMAVLFAVAVYVWYEMAGRSVNESWERNAYATLIYGGQDQKLLLDSERSITDANGEEIIRFTGDSLIYLSKNRIEPVQQDQILVPFGKTLVVVLGDASVIELNAGSSLRYPAGFIPGETRNVFLEGQAWFEVSHDANSPFIVQAYDLNVKVLGTAFDVKAYPESQSTDVALLEGSVSMYDDDHKAEAVLKPGMMGSLRHSGDQAVIQRSAIDVESYSSWRTGDLVFEDTSLEEVLLTLERQYNVYFEVLDKEILDKRITGTFKMEGLPVIMQYLGDLYNIQYNIENDRVIINSIK